MNRITTNKIIMAVILIVLAGCSESNNPSNQIPSKVFIPASDFSQTLWISLQTPNVNQIPEGEWIQLEAERQTGPWVEIESNKLDKDQCWVARMPARKEENVQGNVRWFVEPKRDYEFNVPRSYSEAVNRTVRFKSPGRYTIKATSHSWCGEPFESNIIEVQVVRRNNK